MKRLSFKESEKKQSETGKKLSESDNDRDNKKTEKNENKSEAKNKQCKEEKACGKCKKVNNLKKTKTFTGERMKEWKVKKRGAKLRKLERKLRQ